MADPIVPPAPQDCIAINPLMTAAYGDKAAFMESAFGTGVVQAVEKNLIDLALGKPAGPGSPTDKEIDSAISARAAYFLAHPEKQADVLEAIGKVDPSAARAWKDYLANPEDLGTAQLKSTMHSLLTTITTQVNHTWGQTKTKVQDAMVPAPCPPMAPAGQAPAR